MELREQVDLINGYEEWKARKKQEALDYSAEAYLRDTAKETALSNLEQVVDYLDAFEHKWRDVKDHTEQRMMLNDVMEIRGIAT